MIKGFRHTAKALFNILEAKYENQRWPCQQYQIPSQVDALMKHVLRRINEAPDLYFMVYTIVDGIFFSESNGAWAAEYCESMPSDYLHTVYADLHRMVVMFGFDGQRRDLEHMINSGIGFEPWIWYWAPETDNEVHKEVFRLVESAHTTWDGAEYGMWLQWFETKVAQIVNGGGQTRAFGAELVPNPRNPKPYQVTTEIDRYLDAFSICRAVRLANPKASLLQMKVKAQRPWSSCKGKLTRCLWTTGNRTGRSPGERSWCGRRCEQNLRRERGCRHRPGWAEVLHAGRVCEP